MKNLVINSFNKIDKPKAKSQNKVQGVRNESPNLPTKMIVSDFDVGVD